MNKNCIIRRATSSDVPALLALVKELAIFEKEPDAVNVTVSEMTEDGFSINKIFDSLVAEVRGEIVGMAITYYRYSTWKGKCLYLEDLIVTDAYRGSGIGQQLFNNCIDFGKENGCKRMIWQVLDWNTPAIEFYKKYGAQLDGEWINGSLEL